MVLLQYEHLFTSSNSTLAARLFATNEGTLIALTVAFSERMRQVASTELTEVLLGCFSRRLYRCRVNAKPCYSDKMVSCIEYTLSLGLRIELAPPQSQQQRDVVYCLQLTYVPP